MKYLGVLLLMILLGSGCAMSNVTKLSNVKYPAISADEVKIFLDEEDMPEAFEKVAIIKVTYSKGFDNAKWSKAKNKAAALGCNGVYERDYIPGFGDEGDRAEIIAIRY